MKSLLEKIDQPLDEALEEQRREGHKLQGSDVAYLCPTSKVGIILRENGFLDAYSENTNLVLDGQDSIVWIHGTYTVLECDNINIQTTGNNSFAINQHPLNYNWLNSEDYKIVRAKDLSNRVITGVPAQGQKSVPLSDFFTEEPLFLSRIIDNKVDQLKKRLKEAGIL